MDATPKGVEATLIEKIYRDSKVQVLRTILEPSQEVPWHFHSWVSDTFYITTGTATVTTTDPDVRTLVHTGEMFRVEPRQPHRVSNETSEQVEFLLIQGIGEYDFRLI